MRGDYCEKTLNGGRLAQMGGQYEGLDGHPTACLTDLDFFIAKLFGGCDHVDGDQQGKTMT